MTEQPPAPARAGLHGRHPVNIGYLVMAVAFAGLFATWALVAGDAVGDEDIRFLLPVPWVLAGVAGLVALVARDRTPGASPPSQQQPPGATMEE